MPIIKQVVTPENLGSSILANIAAPNKYDVFINPATMEYTPAGAISAKAVPAAPDPLKQDKTSVATHTLVPGTIAASQIIRITDQGLNSDIAVDNLFSVAPTKDATGKIVLPVGGTPFNLSGTTTDALSNKTAQISRTGDVMLGATTAPVAKLHVEGAVLFRSGQISITTLTTNVLVPAVDLYSVLHTTSTIPYAIAILPAPTNTTSGRLLTVVNQGPNPVVYGSDPQSRVVIFPNRSVSFVWHNGRWNPQEGGSQQSRVSPIATAQTNTVIAFNDIQFRYSLNATNGNLEVSSMGTAIPAYWYGEERYDNSNAAVALSGDLAVTIPAAGIWTTLNYNGSSNTEIASIELFTGASWYTAKVANFNGTFIHLSVTKNT